MNINEIAKLAGVSRATVSRYLNHGYVSEEKREAIKKTIQKTGYSPCRQARNLRSRSTGLIGVVIPRIQSESVARMVAGIGDILGERDYQLILANTNNSMEEEIRYLRTFRKNQVDGLLFMGTGFTKEHLACMKKMEIPLVIMAQEIPGFSCVFQDDFGAGYEAGEQFLRKGKKHAYIGVTTKDKAVGIDRKGGVLKAADELGIQIEKEKLPEAEFGIQGGYESTAKILKAFPDTDSILCATDSLAAGALRYLHEKGIRVPEQVQLMGFGDTELGNITTPAISTVRFHYRSTGREAARLLLEILDTGKDFKKQLKMGFEVIQKGSAR